MYSTYLSRVYFMDGHTELIASYHRHRNPRVITFYTNSDETYMLFRSEDGDHYYKLCTVDDWKETYIPVDDVEYIELN